MHISWHWIAIVLAVLVRYVSLTWDFERSSDAGPRPPTDVHEQLVHMAKLETWVLRGQRHIVAYRGWVPHRELADGSTPVILSIHGGPGVSAIPDARRVGADLLEQHFVVVHYDQRSAGKSCKFHHDFTQDLSIDQHVDDAAALVEKIQERFGVAKVYLIGGSWGTVVASNLARRHPELVHKVVLRGTLVDARRNEELSREFILERLGSRIKPDDVPRPPYGSDVDALLRQRGYLTEAGGLTYECFESRTCSGWMLKAKVALKLLTAPEYSWADVLRYHSCVTSTLHRLWPEVEQYNASVTVSELAVPLFLFHGRYDRCTSAELVEGYFGQVRAPQKHLVWFERSGHQPDLEEPQRFQRLVLRAFLAEKFQVAETDALELEEPLRLVT